MAKVLVVDDDPAVVTMLVRLLEGGGYKAVPCSSAEVGLGIIDHEAFDLVLTDVHMPTMNGVELLLQLRTLFPHLPVVAMSGSAPDQRHASLELCKRFGAKAILEKPFRGQELYDVIASVIE